MKQIKFTSENLQRHLNAKPYASEHYYLCLGKRIHTVRDEVKGKIGDVFSIDGVGKFVLVTLCTYEADGCEFDSLIENEWDCEGFKSETEFRQEILRIYENKPKYYYEHVLLKLNED